MAGKRIDFTFRMYSSFMLASKTSDETAQSISIKQAINTLTQINEGHALSVIYD